MTIWRLGYVQYIEESAKDLRSQLRDELNDVFFGKNGFLQAAFSSVNRTIEAKMHRTPRAWQHTRSVMEKYSFRMSSVSQADMAVWSQLPQLLQSIRDLTESLKCNLYPFLVTAHRYRTCYIALAFVIPC